MQRHAIIGTLTFSSAVFLALAALPSSAFAQKAGAQQLAASAEKILQRQKDFEHEVVQTDGVNHPRETVKGGKAAPKAVPVAKKKDQRDLDLEHELVQTDGINHPRRKVTDRNVDSPKAGTAAKKTQRDLDFEHELVQTGGVNHPRETIGK